MYDKRATVKEPIVIEGVDVRKIKKNTTAEIRPEQEGRGLYFTINADPERIPYDIHHLYAYRHPVVGARYNVVSSARDEGLTGRLRGEKQIHVVEHLVSALYAAGITDAEVNIKNGGSKIVSAPSLGPGIEAYFKLLQGKREELDFPLEAVRVTRMHGYKPTDEKKGVQTSITIAPRNSLEIRVASARQADLFPIGEQEMEVTDFYGELEKHLSARPIGRLKNPFIFAFWKMVNWLGYRGITDENYITARLFDDEKSLVKKMHPEYRLGRNEFLAHTIFSDFFGELCSLGSPYIRGRFALKNASHLSRVAALKQFAKEEGLLVKEPLAVETKAS